MSERWERLLAIREAIREAVRRARGLNSPARLQIAGLNVQIEFPKQGELLGEPAAVVADDAWRITDLFDVVQGVTWGGESCESIFVVKNAHGFDKDLLYKTLAGRDVKPGRIEWSGDYIVFPYTRSGHGWLPSFGDSLDIDRPLDAEERSLLGRPLQILDHRIARNLDHLARFPNTATYLVEHYEKLREREFEGKNITELNKFWYEFHRPRTPRLTVRPKIVSRRLAVEACFAIDDIGFLPRDSIVAFMAKEHEAAYQRLRQAMGSEISALQYVVEHLNSADFNRHLQRRRAKRKGNYVIIDERLLSSYTIPKPRTRT